MLQACGILIGVASPSVFGFALGSILLGLRLTAITLFAMRDTRRLHGDQGRGLMGLLTVTYGIGKIIGTPLATRQVQRSGSFTSSLCLAAFALIASAIPLGQIFRESRRPLA